MKLPLYWQKIIFYTLILTCVLPFVEPPLALMLGFVLSFFVGNPYQQHNAKISKYLLQISVVGLGFGMNLHQAIQVGKDGFFLTIASISMTLIAGIVIGKLLNINKSTSFLISGGTAICGGSAIATLAPIIRAQHNEISVALACIFVLNAVALIIFPLIGQWLNLTQSQFGWWAAIAIHDTSSVVGAAYKYGQEALSIATTVKLERALWIIPISIGFILLNKKNATSIQIPYFILGFIVAIFIVYYFPQIKPIAEIIVLGAKKMLNICLFIIASGLSITTLKQVGVKPLLQGILLWIFISACSLLIILQF